LRATTFLSHQQAQYEHHNFLHLLQFVVFERYHLLVFGYLMLLYL